MIITVYSLSGHYDILYDWSLAVFDVPQVSSNELLKDDVTADQRLQLDSWTAGLGVLNYWAIFHWLKSTEKGGDMMWDLIVDQNDGFYV